MKFLTFLGVCILISITLVFLGPIIGFAIGALMVYYGYQSFMKSSSTIGKIIWGIVGLIGISITASSLPAIIGIGALLILIHLYNKKKQVQSTTAEYKDFQNFEQEWKEIMSKHN